MNDDKQLWGRALAEIEVGVSKANFSTWFKNTSIIKEDEGVVYIGVPSEFVRDWLLNKFHKTILRSLRSVAESTRAIEYVIVKDAPKQAASSRTAPDKLFVQSLPLEEHYITREDNLNPRYILIHLLLDHSMSSLLRLLKRSLTDRAQSIIHSLCMEEQGWGRHTLYSQSAIASRRIHLTRKYFIPALRNFLLTILTVSKRIGRVRVK